MKELWNRNYIILLISNFLAGQSYVEFMAVSPLYVARQGGDLALAGLMASALTFATLLTRPLFGGLIDKIGRRPIMLWGSVAFALNTVAYFFVSGIAPLFVLRIFHGICTSMYVVSTSTLVADLVPASRLTDGIGFFSVSSTLSQALGPIVSTTVVGQWGFPALFAVMTVLAVSGGALAFFVKVPPRCPAANTVLPGNPPPRSRGILEWAVIVPSILSGMIYLGTSSVNNFLPAYGLSKGLASISLFFVANGIFMLLVRLVSQKLISRFGQSIVVASGLCAVAASFLLVVAASGALAIFLAGMLFGMGTGIVFPIFNVMVFQMCAPERKGTANATFGLCNDIGNGTGAAVWGFLSREAGYAPVYTLAALCPLCTLLVYGLLRRGKGRKEATSSLPSQK